MTTAPAHTLPAPGFATMVTPAPVAEVQTVIGTGARWASTGLQLLFVGLLVPVAILLVGAPIALLARAVIAVMSRLAG